MISLSSVVVFFSLQYWVFSGGYIKRPINIDGGSDRLQFFSFLSHPKYYIHIWLCIFVIFKRLSFSVLAIMVNILVIIGGSGGRWRRYWLLLTIILLLRILNILKILNILDVLNILNILNILKLKVDRLPKFNRYKIVTVLIESCRAFWTRVWSNWGVQRVCLVGR